MKLCSLLLAAVLVLGACASSAPTSFPPSGALQEQDPHLGYKTPEEALHALQQKPGVTIREQQGWTIVEDRESVGGMALWSFTPKGHRAYPSVVKRYTYEENGKVMLRMGVICGSTKESCDALVRDFQALNDRMIQNLQERKQ